MDWLEELESAPWPKFCREAAEQNSCRVCTNEEHAELINTIINSGKKFYCSIDCDKKNAIVKSCSTCKYGRFKQVNILDAWECSEYSIFYAGQCRAGNFGLWEGKDEL